MWKEQRGKNIVCCEIVEEIGDKVRPGTMCPLSRTCKNTTGYSYCKGCRQRALPANMIIWEQSLSVQYTESAFVTEVLDKNCTLRKHSVIHFVSLFQPLLLVHMGWWSLNESLYFAGQQKKRLWWLKATRRMPDRLVPQIKSKATVKDCRGSLGKGYRPVAAASPVLGQKMMCECRGPPRFPPGSQTEV